MAMSDEHKAALAKGRKESRAIKLYLDAISTRRPGRPVSPERLKARIATLMEKIAAADDSLKALGYRQDRLAAEADLQRVEAAADIEVVEAGFVEHAASYSGRKGISYAAWREQGVPSTVLAKAGIGRTRSS